MEHRGGRLSACCTAEWQKASGCEAAATGTCPHDQSNAQDLQEAIPEFMEAAAKRDAKKGGSSETCHGACTARCVTQVITRGRREETDAQAQWVCDTRRARGGGRCARAARARRIPIRGGMGVLRRLLSPRLPYVRLACDLGVCRRRRIF